jgi:PPOX class probable F420-dependent enzyme
MSGDADHGAALASGRPLWGQAYFPATGAAHLDTLLAVASLHPALRELIESGPLAHVVTLNDDGSPQVTVVWIALDGDDVVTAHMGIYRKLRNIQRDARIAISLEAPRQPGVFMADYAVLYGTATLESGGGADLLRRLGKRYVAPDFEFPLGPDAGDGYLMRTRVERVTGHGPWVG